MIELSILTAVDLRCPNMTELFRRVIAEIEKLPDEQQDGIATRLLAELKDEQAWKTKFEATTDEH